MKSPLVDAIRRANSDEPGEALTTSGSFVATRRDFGTTANDANVAGELRPEYDDPQLPESTRALVSDTTHGEESHEPAADDEFAPAAVEYANGRGRCAPAIARYCPVLCVALAIVAAGAWIVLQQIAMSVDRVGVAAQSLAPGVSDDTSRALTRTGRVKFRFIDGPLAVTEEPPE